MRSSASVFVWAADKHLELARKLLRQLATDVGQDLADAVLSAPQICELEIRTQRVRVAELKTKLLKMGHRSRRTTCSQWPII